MSEIILALISQLNASVFTLIVILIVVIVGVYKAGGIVKSFKLFDKKNDKVDDKIDTIKETLQSIKATTDLLYEAHLRTVQGQSPLNLTPLGKEIALEISAKEKISGHWQKIKTKLEEQSPQNPYDIQVVALQIARECFDKIFSEEDKDQIKTIAFKKGLNLLEIYPIIGIGIRDKIFEERKIKPDEVDKHDPSSS